VPRNRETPIAARLDLRLSDSEARISAEFDWRQTGDQSWDIDIRTRSGTRLNLSKGGSVLSVDGKVVVEEPPASTRASTSGSRP
jgi:D-galactose 1-dehydrogenase